MTLPEHDDACFREFTRITGSTCHFAFVRWMATKLRDGARQVSFAQFRGRDTDFRHSTTLEYLQKIPTGSEA